MPRLHALPRASWTFDADSGPSNFLRTLQSIGANAPYYWVDLRPKLGNSANSFPPSHGLCLSWRRPTDPALAGMNHSQQEETT